MPEQLARLLEALGRGKVVAIATESSFGLLSDIRLAEALDTLVSLKPRGSDKGQPLLVPDIECWRCVVRGVPEEALWLAQRFWPGRLSIVLEARPHVDARVVLDGTLAVRIPGASPALDLVTAYGAPVTATSANLPGQPPALHASEVVAAFGDAVRDGRLVVVAGSAPGGPPSTLVRPGPAGWQVLREGAISSQTIHRTLASERAVPQ